MSPVASIELHFFHFSEVVKMELSTYQTINYKEHKKSSFFYCSKKFTMVKTTHNNTDEHFCNSTGLMKEKPDKSP